MNHANTETSWFKQLCAECRAIIGPARTKIDRLRVKWLIGRRIGEDTNYAIIVGGRGCKGFISRLAVDLHVSKRTLQRCVQFYKKAPELILENDAEEQTASRVTQFLEPPDGEVPTWKWVVEEYLPDKSEDDAAFQVGQVLIEPAVDVLDEIDLDPCCSRGQNVPANLHLSPSEGLTQPWRGSVFLRPPARTAANWVEYLILQHEQGITSSALALLPATTDSKWFGKLGQYPKCFLSKRPKLGPSDARSPMMVIYLGKQPERFIRVFSAFGDVHILAPPAGSPIRQQAASLSRTGPSDDIDQMHLSFSGSSVSGA